MSHSRLYRALNSQEREAQLLDGVARSHPQHLLLQGPDETLGAAVAFHANAALDETHCAEFFWQGAEARGLIRSKRWLLLRRWANLNREERQTLRDLFALNRRLAKAYLLKEQRGQLWSYTYEGRGAPLLAPRPALAAVASLPTARPAVDAASGRHTTATRRSPSESRRHQREHPSECCAVAGTGITSTACSKSRSPDAPLVFGTTGLTWAGRDASRCHGAPPEPGGRGGWISSGISYG